MYFAPLFLLLTLPTLDRSAFFLTQNAVVATASPQVSSDYVDYTTGRSLAVKLKKNLVVCKNLNDVTAYQKKAEEDHAVFCVSNLAAFKDGVNEYTFKDGELYSKESLDAIAEAEKVIVKFKSYDELVEDCADGSCGVNSSGGSSGSSKRFFSAGSCASCR